MLICRKQNNLITCDATSESIDQTLRETQEKWPRIVLLTLQTKQKTPIHGFQVTDWLRKNGHPV